jgi:hypothetical protein
MKWAGLKRSAGNEIGDGSARPTSLALFDG